MVILALLWGLLLAGSLAPAGAAPASDRLERFREIARARLAEVEDTGRALDPDVQGEIDALLDDEVLDSLKAGGPYASVAFIRERLESFTDAWGGASLTIQDLGDGLLVGRFRLSARGVGNSVRLYRAARGTVGLLRAWREGGVPEVYRWSAPSGGGVEFLLAWSGDAGPRSWPLRLELWRMRGGTLTPAWRSVDQYSDGLWVSFAEVGAGRITLRRELRYPGWKPGCEGQTEQEDRYRRGPGGGLLLTGRQVFDGWHRELQRSATRFFAALAAGDGRTLVELVPDAAVRLRLPKGLVAEAACDAQNPDTPGTVVVAAAVMLPSGVRSPWSLWWGRSRMGWRLTGAAAVLE